MNNIIMVLINKLADTLAIGTDTITLDSLWLNKDGLEVIIYNGVIGRSNFLFQRGVKEISFNYINNMVEDKIISNKMIAVIKQLMDARLEYGQKWTYNDGDIVEEIQGRRIRR